MIRVGNCSEWGAEKCPRTTEETGQGTVRQPWATERIDEIFQDEEDVFGREVASLFLNLLRYLQHHVFLAWVSVPIAPSYILADSICTNLLQVDGTNLSAYRNSYVHSFPYKHLHWMQRYTRNKLFLRVILIILNCDCEKYHKLSHHILVTKWCTVPFSDECVSIGMYILVFLHV